MLSPKISTTASFIHQFPLHLDRSFRVAAVNSSFTPANRILLESPIVGLSLAVWIQQSPVVISLRKGEGLRKEQTQPQADPFPFMESRLREQSWHCHSPRDSGVTLMSLTWALRARGVLQGILPLKIKISAL